MSGNCFVTFFKSTFYCYKSQWIGSYQTISRELLWFSRNTTAPKYSSYTVRRASWVSTFINTVEVETCHPIALRPALLVMGAVVPHVAVPRSTRHALSAAAHFVLKTTFKCFPHRHIPSSFYEFYFCLQLFYSLKNICLMNFLIYPVWYGRAKTHKTLLWVQNIRQCILTGSENIRF